MPDFFAPFFARFFAPFFGTLAPFFLASDRPIAIACLRLFTVRPLPLLSFPRFFLCIAFFTLDPADLEYLAIAVVLVTESKKFYAPCDGFSTWRVSKIAEADGVETEGK